MKKIALILALVAGSAHAEFMDGNRLLDKIVSSSYYEQGSAMGYIMGVADMGLGVIHCAPANVTAGQLQDMIRNYLTNTPAQRHLTADALVNRVFKASWPCPDRPAGRSM